MLYLVGINLPHGENNMKLGIVGLPNVGKSTLFNAITKAGAECANYPFCTIEPNVGIVAVPDARLTKLTELYHSQKTTPAVIEFVDIAGIVKGASKGEGLGNKFLSHIREVDAIVHVVRCFDDQKIIHVSNSVNPLDDIDTINTELILADLETVQKRYEKASKGVKGGSATKEQKDEARLLEICMKHLEQGYPIRTLKFEEDDKKIVDGFFLLTDKPVLYCANIGENEIGKPENKYVEIVKSRAKEENAEVIVLCAKIEEEIATLSDDEKVMFYADLGITESGLDILVKASYKLLGLISYLTAGEKETRAWTITNGTKAPQAAGKIHTDFEKGFIRAEVASFDDIISCGGYVKAKEQGKVRMEGKEYVMKDGDVVLFRFNV